MFRNVGTCPQVPTVCNTAGSVESAVHILPGLAIVIGIIALCLAQPWLTIPVGIGCYALWRTG